MRRFLIAGSFLGWLACSTPPVHAEVITFDWRCDANCHVATSLDASVLLDIDNLPIDGSVAPIVTARILWEFQTGGGGTNDFLGSNPIAAAHITGGRYDVANETLQILLDGPASFYYGIGFNFTASGSSMITSWLMSPYDTPETAATGHFGACPQSGTGNCFHYYDESAPVPEPSTLLLLSSGVGATIWRHWRRRASKDRVT
jgi:hypothetical protein